MNEITLENILNKIKEYCSDDLTIVTQAYEYAELLHGNQTRASGEPYIIHPLNVAYILAEEYCDINILCAGLLHDTVEDTNCTILDIEHDFSKDIAFLVNGVTKISDIPFSTPVDLNNANLKKLLEYMIVDIRVILIKLADRLHNMRTLQFKSKEKQRTKAYETMETFVPLAYYVGAYRIKNELEDLSFKYLREEDYKRISELYHKIDIDSRDCLTSMSFAIRDEISKDNVECNIKMRIKHIYGIYKRLCEGHKVNDIHDLLNLKVMVDSINECYLTLGRVHKLYHPVNDKFKDYIFNPKTNLYQSIHTTLFAPEDRLVQAQIRTFDMDKVASFGLPMYWYLNKDVSRESMQEEFKAKFQVYNNIKQISEYFTDNKEFVENVKKELLSENVYVYSQVDGQVYELPKGSTPVDFAYRLGTSFGNQIVGAIVNDHEVELDYQLENNDRIFVKTDDKAFPQKKWEDSVITSLAKRKIKDFNIANDAIKRIK